MPKSIKAFLGLESKISSKPKPNFLVVGLGNPGSRYKHTRHNMGHDALDEILSLYKKKKIKDNFKGKADIKYVFISDNLVALAKLNEYVNLSGGVVRKLLRYFELELDELIVLYDDINLDPGIIRVRPEGSAGGHNGVKSVIEILGTNSFKRVRIGVGKPKSKGTQINHVTSRPTSGEVTKIRSALKNAAYATSAIVTDGVDVSMNKFNLST